ncbi:MAG: pyridoxal phosphate-dependent aminotransferase [Planctomycetota bacterium]|nr:pyridoxal phosphate-dependent aminotransferase [Planctomycetota bacterium]MDA1106085.1 pyridoxal phosphate-dependent aminotransferase [Planctomycetota bacterium]
MTAPTTSALDPGRLICDRSRSIDASGIRAVWQLSVTMKDPINLSIGQPDFGVPEPVIDAAVLAITEHHNGYSLTAGAPAIQDALWSFLGADLGWHRGDRHGALITSGTSGALVLAALAVAGPGDEIVYPDPYFILYPQLARLTGAVGVPCDTYPDFRMTAERIEQCLTPRTKMVVLVSPSNPCGTVMGEEDLRDIVHLCRSRGIVLVSDEIYDQFTYSESLEQGRCPSAARLWDEVLAVRGFGKTYGATGWRLGYAAGPKWLTDEMAKLQQYTYVCAPTPLQRAIPAMLAHDMGPIVRRFQARRDTVVEAFRGVTSVPHPGGAFYAFVEVPSRLGMTASAFAARAVERNTLVIPGKVFSSRDTHFRLSFATPDEKLAAGLAALRSLMLD